MKVLTTPRSYGKTDPEVFSMLQAAGVGVAMGNAGDAVKAAADYVTTDVDGDGIWNACEHLGLL